MTQAIKCIFGEYEKVLPRIGSKVDLILIDPPYGNTQCSWDTPFNLIEMWEKINLVTNPNTPVLIFAQTPFDKILGFSNIKELKYEWIWEKIKATGHLNAKKMPMKAHENILVFYKKLPKYFPQKIRNMPPVNNYTKHTQDGPCYGKTRLGISGGGSTERYPRSVLKFSSDTQKSKIHPTQKPIALLEYLIKTYTNENDTVLDFCMGSGSTGVACKNLNRKFIGVESNRIYYNRALDRIKTLVAV